MVREQFTLDPIVLEMNTMKYFLLASWFYSKFKNSKQEVPKPEGEKFSFRVLRMHTFSYNTYTLFSYYILSHDANICKHIYMLT